MAAPLKIAATVSIDPSQAKAGAKDAMTSIDGIGASAVTASSKLQRLIETSAGIGGGAANNNIREWSGALAMAGRSADELRAKYNPLFAVIAQYKQNLIEIRTLTAQGVLTTDEMTSAIQRQRQATLASIDAIKGRNTAMGSGHFSRSNMAATNSMFQFQDIAMTAAMGMNPAMIGLQQGTQLAGGFAGMSIKEAGAAALGGLSGLLSPLSLVTVGLTAATAAAIQFFSSSASQGKTASDVIEAQANLVKELADAWGIAGNQARTYNEAQKIISQTNASAGLIETQKKQQSAFDTINAKFFEYGVGKGYNNIPGFAEQYGKAFSDLQTSIKNGSADVDGFVEAIKRIDDANPGFSKVGNEFIKLADDLNKLNSEAKKTVDILSQIALQGARLDPLGVFDASKQQQRIADLTPSKTLQLQQQIDAYRLTTNAKSAEEKAAAARATAAAQVNRGESSTDRANRIELAGQQALIAAEKELTEAKRERLRSIGQTLESSRLELTLIGQSTSAMEAQRMELRLMTEAKIAAEKAGTVVSADEIERIKQASAEYGRLQEAIKATNILRDQSNNIEQLRLEISLVGQSEAVRTRALALAQAEQTIRDQGIEANSRNAQAIRANAAATADETLKLGRLGDAWNTVKTAGEDAIDQIGEALRTGDWAGAASAVLADIQKSVIQLGLTNPLKNELLGTNYGTLADAGGLIGKLFGGNGATSAGVSAVGAMNVNAASVIINGGISTGGPGGGLGAIASAANDNLVGIGGASKTNQSGVAAQVWNYFAGKGLKDFQTAAIMGNVGGESNFDPLAVGDGGKALGLFQHNDRAPSLLNFIGGRSNLGNVQSQLEFAWKELQTSESGVLSRLLKTTNVRDATSAFAGFERPRGWSLQNPEGADNFSGRLKGAEAALSKFGGSVNTAGSGLGTLSNGLTTISSGLNSMGSGLSDFGKSLTSYFPSAPSSSGGGIGSLFSKLFGSIFVPNGAQASLAASGSIFGLFDNGGYTGPGGKYEAAGLVHRGEVVWSQEDIARAGGVGIVEFARRRGLKGYADGGVVYDVGPNYAANQNSRPSASQPVTMHVTNYSSAKVEDPKETTDDRGGRHISFTIADQVGSAIGKKGGAARKTIEGQYGVRSKGVKR
jgi:hypothetical protein